MLHKPLARGSSSFRRFVLPPSPRFIGARTLSTTPIRASSSSSSSHSDDHANDHGSHYDPPGGWLWGIRPGEKYEQEGWETLFFFGYFVTFGLAAVAYAFKPDTTIQTWALEEARRRLEKEGILEDPEK